MLGRVPTVSRVDAGVAAVFVAAGAAEAVVRHASTPGLLVVTASGALWLGSLAMRRRHPVVTLALLCGAAVLGTALTQLWWPDQPDGGGVWLFAIMLAAYSLGAHARGRVLVLGALLPLTLALAADLTTLRGWPLVSGVVFITVFLGLVPTAVGRLVRSRHDRLLALGAQHDQIVRALQGQRESSVLAERLRTTERLQPTLVQGLRALAHHAESGGTAEDIETQARGLLERTREEVVALTAPIDEVGVLEVPAVDHVDILRTAAQPWAAVAACAVAAGLAIESTSVLALSAPDWLAVALSMLVGAPLGLSWWRPAASAAGCLVMATIFSRLLAPLDGSLSETGLVLALAFTVGALCRRRAAVLGLAVCWAGQLVGVGTDDPLGDAVALAMCWLGGLALNEASRLVEQGRANNALLASQESARLQRAVVDERLRFARELHDAIGSSLTVIVLQAGAARRLAATSPERAREVMGDVAAAARDGVAALAPEGDVPDVQALVERARAAGLVVDARVADVVRLDPTTRALVHRLVQEALTNVLRHAVGSRASLRLEVRDGQVELSVTNTAGRPGQHSPGSGRGLTGIRERVAAASGVVTCGPLPDGGFEVRARLPLPLPTRVAP